jgi:hypothetical protein
MPVTSEVTQIRPSGMTAEQKEQLDRELETAKNCNGRLP